MYMAAGLEETYNYYIDTGDALNLSWETKAGAWQYQWSSGSSYSYLYQDNPPARVYWTTRYKGVVFYGDGGCTASPVSTSQVNSSFVLPTLLTNVASAFGGQSPSVAQVVTTTRAKANGAASAGVVYTDEPAYLVQMEGDFTAPAARVPPGHPVPSGHYLILVIDLSSGQVLDSGVTDRSADLGSVGVPAEVQLWGSASVSSTLARRARGLPGQLSRSSDRIRNYRMRPSRGTDQRQVR
jgi:hypothetical protein